MIAPRAVATAIAIALCLGACGGGAHHSSAAKSTSSTSSATSSIAATGPPATPSQVAATESLPTVPPHAPSGAAPLDVTAVVVGYEPATNVLAVDLATGAGILLVEVGRARVTGVTAAADLLPGARIRVVGYSEREAGLRVFTATELSVR